MKVTAVVVESSCINQPSEEVAADLRDLAQACLPMHLRTWPTEMPFSSQASSPCFPDICFIVEGQRFMCHKVKLD